MLGKPSGKTKRKEEFNHVNSQIPLARRGETGGMVLPTPPHSRGERGRKDRSSQGNQRSGGNEESRRHLRR